MGNNCDADIICIGMALVDSIIKGFDATPISASGYRAVSGSLNVGGEAVNEAVTAAKLGVKTAIMCSLGTDDAGDTVINTLKRNKVATDYVIRSEEHPTPVTTMFVNEDGSRKSITNLAHKYNFHPENYLEGLKGIRGVILGSLFRAPFDDPQIIEAVLKNAKAEGALTFADTKLPNFNFLKPEDISDSLKYVDYITPNEDEARYFTGKEKPSDMADVFLKYGVKNVVVKLGSKGCYLKNKDMELLLPSYNIDAVDATGAGDNFVAGLACELLRGADIQEAVRFANACGAICTTAVGAGSALKNREQVINFMKENQH